MFGGRGTVVDSFAKQSKVHWLTPPVFWMRLFIKESEGPIQLFMSRDMTKPTKWVCAQRRLRSAWASAQSDQSLRCALNGQLKTQAFFMWTAKTDQTGRMPRLIWVFAGRTVTLLVLSFRGSYVYVSIHLDNGNGFERCESDRDGRSSSSPILRDDTGWLWCGCYQDWQGMKAENQVRWVFDDNNMDNFPSFS